MANIHPRLYTKLCREPDAPDADLLQAALSMCALIERQCYPVNAKYYLTLEGLPMTTTCRVKEDHELNATFKSEVEQLRLLNATLYNSFL